MSFLSVLAHLARQKEGTINQDEIKSKYLRHQQLRATGPIA